MAAGIESACSVGDWGLIPGLGRPTPVFWPGELHGLFHGVAKSQTRLSNFHFHYKKRNGLHRAREEKAV